MNRARRTRILIGGRAELRSRLSGQIERTYLVQEIDAANEGLVMLKMRDSARHTLYYLGEVLVTEAKVKIGEGIGIGLVAGSLPSIARELAVIDAAYNARLPETIDWEEDLVEEELLIAERERLERGRIAKTRVSFETMDTQ